jgi:thymidylate synthase (FAD)
VQSVKLQWATPEIDKQILYIARVSNPKNQSSGQTSLLQYLMSHGHVSPFEMANVCFEINTTRDIGRQILRHRSFCFQEFSQRYAATDELGAADLRECRLKDIKNRQNSIPCLDEATVEEWNAIQRNIMKYCGAAYKAALDAGIAKEQARALLPEGLTMSRLYMNGTLRSWIHYLNQRLDPTTQKEHREVAQMVLAELRKVAPITMNAFFPKEST